MVSRLFFLRQLCFDCFVHINRRFLGGSWKHALIFVITVNKLIAPTLFCYRRLSFVIIVSSGHSRTVPDDSQHNLGGRGTDTFQPQFEYVTKSGRACANSNSPCTSSCFSGVRRMNERTNPPRTRRRTSPHVC